MRLSCWLILIALALPQAARGQETRGFGWGISLGGAWLDMDCSGCEALADSMPYRAGRGFGGSVSRLWRVHPRVGVGGAIVVSGRERSSRSAALLVPALVGEMRFGDRSGGFVRGGFGPSYGNLSGRGTLIEATGAAAVLEAGVEVARVGTAPILPTLGFTWARHSAESASVHRLDDLPPIGPPRYSRAVFFGIRLGG